MEPNERVVADSAATATASPSPSRPAIPTPLSNSTGTTPARRTGSLPLVTSKFPLAEQEGSPVPLTERVMSDPKGLSPGGAQRAEVSSPRPSPRFGQNMSNVALMRFHDNLRKWSTDRPFSATPPEPEMLLRQQLMEDMEHLHPKDIDQIIETVALMMRERSSATARQTVMTPSRTFSTQVLMDIESKLQESAQHISVARLCWETPPRSILLIKKHKDREVAMCYLEVVAFLTKSFPDITFFAPGEVIAEELQLCKEGDGMRAVIEVLRPWSHSHERRYEATDLDMIISFGGDGTLLHAASLFQCEMPPVMSFSLGSLGFLTPFELSSYRETLSSVLVDGGNMVTVRMRLKCEIVRRKPDVHLALGDKSDETEGEEASEDSKSRSSNGSSGSSGSSNESSGSSNSSSHAGRGGDGEHVTERKADCECKAGDAPCIFHVMNELVVDRGPSSFICNMDVYVDGTLVTNVQGDGLIVATPTGSTAYSVAAGGSVVHPHVPCFLLTPICPHSLSFRPIIVPSSVNLRITIPEDARNPAWCSFDGRNNTQLRQGDSVIITISPWPVSTINKAGQTPDWFESLSSGLGWNSGRQRQRAFNLGQKM